MSKAHYDAIVSKLQALRGASSQMGSQARGLVAKLRYYAKELPPGDRNSAAENQLSSWAAGLPSDPPDLETPELLDERVRDQFRGLACRASSEEREVVGDVLAAEAALAERALTPQEVLAKAEQVLAMQPAERDAHRAERTAAAREKAEGVSG